jgi:hypothetical protein
MSLAPWSAAHRCERRAGVRRVLAALAAIVLPACGGSDPEPRLTIDSPATASATQALHFTSTESVRLAGSVEHATFVRASNRTSVASTEARLVYRSDRGSWEADVRLEPGANVIFVTAYGEGAGSSTTRRIDVTRVER